MPSDQVFIRAMMNLQTKLMKFELKNFIDLYITHNAIWSAINTNFNEYYLNLNDSFKIVNHLVQFQLNCLEDDKDVRQAKCKAFWTDIYNVMEKIIPKKNTIYVVSPPSAGKNFLFDAILAFYLNVGNMSNFVRGANFPYQDCRFFLLHRNGYDVRFFKFKCSDDDTQCIHT